MSSGYTVKFSLDTIRQLVDDGGFHDRQDVQRALNDLEIIRENGRVSASEYDYLAMKLRQML